MGISAPQRNWTFGEPGDYDERSRWGAMSPKRFLALFSQCGDRDILGKREIKLIHNQGLCEHVGKAWDGEVERGLDESSSYGT